MSFEDILKIRVGNGLYWWEVGGGQSMEVAAGTPR